MLNLKTSLDILEDQIISYNYFLRRQNRDLNAKELNDYIRKKINKKFSGQIKEILSNYFVLKVLQKKFFNELA